MKNIIVIGLFYHLYICKWCFALYSSKELEIYNVFVKPYGISFKDEIILKISPDFKKCANLSKSFEDCNSIATNFTSSTTASEYTSLKSLSRTCPSGSYNCFYKTVKSNLTLEGWFKKVQDTVRNLCKKRCWKTMQLVVNRCAQTEQSAVKVNVILGCEGGGVGGGGRGGQGCLLPKVVCQILIFICSFPCSCF